MDGFHHLEILFCLQPHQLRTCLHVRQSQKIKSNLLGNKQKFLQVKSGETSLFSPLLKLGKNPLISTYWGEGRKKKHENRILSVTYKILPVKCFITKALTEIQLRGELDRSEVMGFEPISGLIHTKYDIMVCCRVFPQASQSSSCVQDPMDSPTFSQAEEFQRRNNWWQILFPEVFTCFTAINVPVPTSWAW